MSKNLTDNNLSTDAQTVVRFWDAHSDIKLGDWTVTSFKRDCAAFKAAADDVVAQEEKLRAVMTERDRLRAEIQDGVTRVRSAVRGFYGPDSAEYEQVGGTRRRDRRRPVRPAKSKPAVPASEFGDVEPAHTNGASLVATNGSGR